MAKSGISYFDETWGVTSGCTPVGAACTNCWAKATAERFPKAHGGETYEPADHCYRGMPNPSIDKDCRGCCSEGSCVDPQDYKYYRTATPFSKVILHPDRLDAPFHWRKPRVVGVSFMGDLFHEDVPDEFLLRVLSVMADTPQHTYLILTKRSRRMELFMAHTADKIWGGGWPNVWWGVSAWDPESFQGNVFRLLRLSVKHHWVSIEPLLKEINVRWALGKGGLSAVIAGAESLGNRLGRPAPAWWFVDLGASCSSAGVPFYLKQRASNLDGTGKLVKLPPGPGMLAWELTK